MRIFAEIWQTQLVKRLGATLLYLGETFPTQGHGCHFARIGLPATDGDIDIERIESIARASLLHC